MGDELKRLVAARGQTKGSITRLANFIATDTSNFLDPKNTEEFTDIEDKYLSALALFEEKCESNGEAPGSGTGQIQDGLSKLPCINIPKFSGENNGLLLWRLWPRSANMEGIPQ
ncbi:hypothetical protein evm_014648 [Chilo suppressalis]|nr:hypothetical protein evm_014648 [Chilo suppressalis]